MVVTYSIKLVHMGADRLNGILMSLLLLVSETTSLHLNALTTAQLAPKGLEKEIKISLLHTGT